MPNHVTSILTINGSQEQIKKVKEFVKGNEEAIDFNKITPMPPWVFSGNLGEKDKKKYGEENCWYNWCAENWGTKWNAYSIEISRKQIKFETAWASPVKLILKLGWLFPEIDFEIEYADEDIGCNLGRIRFKDTEIIEEYHPESSSKKAVKMALEIKDIPEEDWGEWGYDKEGNSIDEE